jgi:universal stress protein E
MKESDMHFKLRRILVAVADDAAKEVVHRAAEIAAKSNARLELFSVVRSDPDALGWMPVENQLITSAVIEARRRQLDKLSALARKHGISVECSVATAHSVTDGIVRRARQSSADLVAIQARKHSRLARLFLSQNDYDLIRHCPVPLLIVKPTTRKGKRPILAAVDPWHANGKPRSLDRKVVAAGRKMAEIMRVSLHSAHAHSPVLGYVDDTALAPVAVPAPGPGAMEYAATIRKRFTAFNAKHKIAARNSHLVLGNPALLLPYLARTTRAQMLVMGAISRAPIKRILIGSTAELVLDTLPCDILVIKPDGFRTSIK